jgi:ABC-2 type transport system ATP-binding protein
MSEVLAMRDVTKSFGRKTVLRGVDLVLAPGEIVGFVGPNGAGKSTCLRILLGLVRRDGGEVRVLSLDPGHADTAIRARCSYLPGETSLYHGMRGQEFLDFGAGFHARHHADLAAEMLARFALPLQRRIRQYSAGMKQQLALVASLSPDVDLYVLDEPDRALDATTRLFLRDVLRELHARGKSLLLSSHHLSELEVLADRLVFLIDGQCIDEARVRAARASLRRRVRLRLQASATPPEGAVSEPDGSFVVETKEDPLRWLARLDPAAIESAEVGVVRLEDLYRALTDGAGNAP